jgi:hypothetical protein
MDAGVVSGTLHATPDPHSVDHIASSSRPYAGKVPATLRVTAVQGHLRKRHRSALLARLDGATMLSHRRRRASLHPTPRRS